jgi:hypothetical protein
MRNQFLKFVPAVLVLIAFSLLFIPKTISYIYIEKFFADTDPYYQSKNGSAAHLSTGLREDYYYPGVQIGKLWKKLGIAKNLQGKDPRRVVLQEEYLFGCSYADHAGCVLPFPVTKEYQSGDYKALRVSSASPMYPDYQYLFFKNINGADVYFAHIDIFDNKKSEPDFKFLDNGLVSISSLAGMGDGYSTKFMQIYRLDGKVVKLLLAVPLEASRKGLGLLDFDVAGSFDYANNVLIANYRISFMAEASSVGKLVRQLPLFTVARQMMFKWNREELVLDPGHSDIMPNDITRIIAGSYGKIYTIFSQEFNKLFKADGIKKAWFAEFAGVVRDEGFELSAPVSKARRP